MFQLGDEEVWLLLLLLLLLLPSSSLCSLRPRLCSAWERGVVPKRPVAAHSRSPECSERSSRARTSTPTEPLGTAQFSSCSCR